VPLRYRDPAAPSVRPSLPAEGEVVDRGATVESGAGDCDDSPSGPVLGLVPLPGLVPVPPPLPGVILFPTDVSLLHQFFSVILMVQNGAPQGDPLTLRELSARVTLPPGLRQASTQPPTPLGVPIPIRVPGPDGILGTADDITFLVAQASGEADVLAEGLQEGTQLVQFDIEGVVDGLPGGKLQTVTGRAQGAVLVRDPTLNVTVTHPEVVRADEQYPLLVPRRHRELRHDQDEDEEVVDAERLLGDVAGEELPGRLSTGEEEQAETEESGQHHPDGGPQARLTDGHVVRGAADQEVRADQHEQPCDGQHPEGEGDIHGSSDGSKTTRSKNPTRITKE